MSTFRAPRGTRDLLPDDRSVFDRLERLGSELAERYGYRPIETPVFEQAAVFERGIGEVTDVVEKELFRLQPRTDEAEVWALRPEPTAGIVRAYVQHGMHTWPQPVKVTMTGPMFRYDRPQAGRYRQFRQFDVEAIGDPGPAVDAEIIELGYRFVSEAGVEGVEVLLNSIGDPVCRPPYVTTLTEWYRTRAQHLPPVELDRLERNALRLLDSKDPAMTGLNAAAPRITDRLCEACAAHFASVQAHLDALGVPYRVEPSLVRGLDYYTRTAFEVHDASLGAQSALGGGGRYDGLVEQLGGPPTPGVGFAIGLDRALLVLAERGLSLEPADTVCVVAMDATRVGATALVRELRKRFRVESDVEARGFGAQMKAAGKSGARFLVIAGEEEWARGEVALKDSKSGEQKAVAREKLADEIAARIRG
jgi:histidyl-tRNA synthetase